MKYNLTAVALGALAITVASAAELKPSPRTFTPTTFETVVKTVDDSTLTSIAVSHKATNVASMKDVTHTFDAGSEDNGDVLAPYAETVSDEEFLLLAAVEPRDDQGELNTILPRESNYIWRCPPRATRQELMDCLADFHDKTKPWARPPPPPPREPSIPSPPRQPSVPGTPRKPSVSGRIDRREDLESFDIVEEAQPTKKTSALDEATSTHKGWFKAKPTTTSKVAPTPIPFEDEDSYYGRRSVEEEEVQATKKTSALEEATSTHKGWFKAKPTKKTSALDNEATSTHKGWFKAKPTKKTTALDDEATSTHKGWFKAKPTSAKATVTATAKGGFKDEAKPSPLTASKGTVLTLDVIRAEAKPSPLTTSKGALPTLEVMFEEAKTTKSSSSALALPTDY